MNLNTTNHTDSSKHLFCAGVAAVDITPVMGTIVGVDLVSRYARFIHDPLYAKALVMKDARETVVIVIVDICIMGTDFMDDIKLRIERATGINPKNILLASNHTHGSGDVVGLLGGAVDIAFRKKLPDLVVKAVERAVGKLVPAQIASGSVNVPEYVLSRRYLMKDGYVAKNLVTGLSDTVKTNPFGAEQFIDKAATTPDPELSFYAIKGLNGRWITVFGNYSLHYVGDWNVDSITADYFGEFSRQIHRKLDADDNFVGIMSNGTSGDINIWDFMNPNRFPKGDYEKTKLIGGALAQKVFEEIANVKWDLNPSISVRFSELEFAVRKPTAIELETAKQVLMNGEFIDLDKSEEGIRKIYAREQILLNEYPDTALAPLQVFKIGNLVIGALPGEFFAETGLWLKKRVTSNKYFSISLANAYCGYVCPAHELERGGYEAWRARSSFLEPKAEACIREEMLRLANNF